MMKASSAVQVVPWDTVNLLTPFFGPGPDPIAARLLSLPVLRGAWITSVDASGNWDDSSGHAHHLTLNGNPEFNYDGLAGYFDYDGTGDFHDRADEADNSVTGTETSVAAAVRGLTAGGWLWADALQDWDYWFSKYDSAGNQRSWALLQDTAANARMRFTVSGNGVATVMVPTDTGLLTTAAWHCCFGRYRANVPAIDIFFDGEWWTVTTSVPVSIFNSTAPLVVGSWGTGAWNLWDGRAAYMSLYAAACSNTQINVFYHMTKRLFGH